MPKPGSLQYLADRLSRTSRGSELTQDHIWYAIRGATDPRLLVANLAEVLRSPPNVIDELLTKHGFGDLVAQRKLSQIPVNTAADVTETYLIGKAPSEPFQNLLSTRFSPDTSCPIELTKVRYQAVKLAVGTLTQSIDQDAFLPLYRNGVLDYHKEFLRQDAPRIDAFLERSFPNGRPRFLVVSGIGANEQFNHFIATLNNNNPHALLHWLIVDSPKQLRKLPPQVNPENTLFMEFSRSGKTEETVKVHEYTPRNMRRIIFANSGPLRELGKRDRNLLLTLPDQVSGRFGRNKTPIVLAPMYVAGLDTESFWCRIDEAIKAFDLRSTNSLPMQIAQFIYIFQLRNSINHIYLACDDEILGKSADEMIQFWNEGVNKNGNDILMSRYLGLPRDSHTVTEGILGNARTKMGLFLLRDGFITEDIHPMISHRIDPVNQEHAGLNFGDEERILIEANYQRFAEVMPTFGITVHGNLTLDHTAILGQLWADVTFCYSRMKNVDPGSNPEVKHVRDRSAQLLAEYARDARSRGDSS